MMNFSKTIKIKNRIISSESKCFIIAEAGVNHNGDLDLAKELIDIATEAGADAVKFQAFKPENLILKTVEKAGYQRKSTGIDEKQYDMLRKLQLTKMQNMDLLSYCNKKGIIFLTTPFDEDSLNDLDELNLPAYKIASTDTTNIPFLKKVAKKGKPIFFSTGMTYLTEIEVALSEIYKYNRDVILLQCSANYPLQANEVNLNVLNTFKEKFGILTGFSDHTEGIGAAPFAIPMGVKVIEKHFTIDKNLIGPDHKASLNAKELKLLINQIKEVEGYMGSKIKKPTLSEISNRLYLQKCFVAKKEIKINESFSEDNIISKRTGGKGISPIYCHELYGKKANKNYSIDEIIEL